MAIRVTCPTCQMILQFDPKDAGKQTSCPSCRGQLLIPVLDDGLIVAEVMAPETDETPIDAVPAIADHVAAEPVSRTPGHQAPRISQNSGIDLNERFEKNVSTKAAAAHYLKVWREGMPEVPSAYQPSGALPIQALLAMTLGTVVGSFAGGGVVVIGGSLVAALAMIVVVGIVCAGLLSIVIGILGLVLSLATFVGAGWVSAWCTTRFGRLGKNRNTRAACMLSTVAGALSGVLAWAFFQFVRNLPNLADSQAFGPRAGSFDIVPLVFAILATLISAAVAAYMAVENVRSDKFCEDCERYMEVAELKRVNLGGLRALALAFKQKDLASVAKMLQDAFGDDGRVDLFTCPCCSRGFLELLATYEANWQEKKSTKEESESWLVASRELAPGDVARFKPNPQ